MSAILSIVPTFGAVQPSDAGWTVTVVGTDGKRQTISGTSYFHYALNDYASFNIDRLVGSYLVGQDLNLNTIVPPMSQNMDSTTVPALKNSLEIKPLGTTNTSANSYLITYTSTTGEVKTLNGNQANGWIAKADDLAGPYTWYINNMNGSFTLNTATDGVWSSATRFPNELLGVIQPIKTASATSTMSWWWWILIAIVVLVIIALLIGASGPKAPTVIPVAQVSV